MAHKYTERIASAQPDSGLLPFPIIPSSMGLWHSGRLRQALPPCVPCIFAKAAGEDFAATVNP